MRRKYDKEFKLNAIRFYQESGKSLRTAEKELGIGLGCLSRWIRNFEEQQEKAFPGNGNPRDIEIMKLKRENELMKQERDILKKALGIFSRSS